MSLITCPDCERQHSDLAPACPQCARPNPVALTVAAPPSLPARAELAHAAAELACPSCGSDDVRKLSVVYREGTSVNSSKTSGVVAGAGGVGAVRARTAGQAQSLLSMGAAPPVRWDTNSLYAYALFTALAVFFIAAGITSSMLVGFIAGALSVIPFGPVIHSRTEWNRYEFPELYRSWSETFMCLRCGHRFEHSDAS